MKRLGYSLIISLACFGVGLAAVVVWNFYRSSRESEAGGVEIISPVSGDTFCSHRRESQIKQVDFSNFAYPRVDSSWSRMGSEFELIDGKSRLYRKGENKWHVELVDVHYGDFISDGAEIATIFMESRYSKHHQAEGLLTWVYTYTMKENRPVLLHSYEEPQ